MKLKLHHIAIVCKDIDESIKFYREAFGIGKVQKNELGGVTYANFEILGTGVKLELETESGLKKAGFMTTENKLGIEHFCFEVDDIDEAYKELKNKGVTFFGGPLTKGPWHFLPNGTGQAFLLGPDEVIIELIKHQ